jgi:hypothetical protein
MEAQNSLPQNAIDPGNFELGERRQTANAENAE